MTCFRDGTVQPLGEGCLARPLLLLYPWTLMAWLWTACRFLHTEGKEDWQPIWLLFEFSTVSSTYSNTFPEESRFHGQLHLLLDYWDTGRYDLRIWAWKHLKIHDTNLQCSLHLHLGFYIVSGTYSSHLNYPSFTKPALSDFCDIHLFLSFFSSFPQYSHDHWHNCWLCPVWISHLHPFLLNVSMSNPRVKFFFLCWSLWGKVTVLHAVCRIA